MDDEIRSYIDAAARAAARATRDEFQVVVEQLEAKIDTIAEGHEVVARRISDMHVDMQSEFSKVRTEMQAGFRETNARIDVSVAQMSDRYANLKERIEKLESIVLHGNK